MYRLCIFLFCVCFLSCSFAQGKNPPHSSEEDDAPVYLISHKEISPCEECPYGGMLVKTGIDSNRDGELSQEEELSLQYICKDDKDLSIYAFDEPAGENCLYGGTRAEAVRADGTIVKTAYICFDEPMDTGDKELMKNILSGSMCSSSVVKISNLSDADLNFTMVKDARLMNVWERKDPLSNAVMEKDAGVPSFLAPGEEAAVALNLQPQQAGEYDIMLIVFADNGTKSGTYAKAERCSIEGGGIIRFADIVRERDIYFTSFYGKPEGYRQCIRNKECFFGMPYGIRKGLYPIDITIQWGDGHTDEVRIHNITKDHILKHIYLDSAKYQVTMKIKTNDMKAYKQEDFMIDVKNE